MPVNLSDKDNRALASQYERWTKVSPSHRAGGREGGDCLTFIMGKYGNENHSIGGNNDHLV